MCGVSHMGLLLSQIFLALLVGAAASSKLVMKIEIELPDELVNRARAKLRDYEIPQEWLEKFAARSAKSFFEDVGYEDWWVYDSREDAQRIAANIVQRKPVLASSGGAAGVNVMYDRNGEQVEESIASLMQPALVEV